MVGGSTIVTLGNGVRALQGKFNELRIDLEKELGIMNTPEDFFGPRTRILRDASLKLGYEVKPMPKFIDFNKCRMCGTCVTGCKYGAKWTALNPLTKARRWSKTHQKHHRGEDSSSKK